MNRVLTTVAVTLAVCSGSVGGASYGTSAPASVGVVPAVTTRRDRCERERRRSEQRQHHRAQHAMNFSGSLRLRLRESVDVREVLSRGRAEKPGIGLRSPTPPLSTSPIAASPNSAPVHAGSAAAPPSPALSGGAGNVQLVPASEYVPVALLRRARAGFGYTVAPSHLSASVSRRARVGITRGADRESANTPPTPCRSRPRSR